MKSEKCKIEVSKKKGVNPPIKYKKSKNKAPDSDHCCFIPRGAFTYLKDHVLYVQWKALEKKVTVSIHETPDFGVYQWITYLRNMHTEIQKSPFVDLESNHVHIVFLDDEGHEVATIRLKNLDVTDHQLHAYTEKCAAMTANTYGKERPARPLAHTVTISYQTEELIMPTEELEDPVSRATHDMTDDEWQTVETP